VARHVEDGGVAFTGTPSPRNMLEHKSFDATIDAFTAPSDDKPYGGFIAVASDESLDRDGERLYRSEWKTPLPERITVDSDHGMSVATTIGSARPYFDGDRLMIDAAFSSLERAQEVRTLVTEGHIKTVSVAALVDRWGGDAGIDLVAKDHDGRLWAIQAKAYAPENAVTKADVDKFLAESSRAVFSYRLLIATTDKLHHVARRTINDQEKKVSFVGLEAGPCLRRRLPPWLLGRYEPS
jgi:hypothetical protein